MNNKFTRGVVSFLYLLILSFVAGALSAAFGVQGPSRIILLGVVITWYATKKKVLGGIGLPYPPPPVPPTQA